MFVAGGVLGLSVVAALVVFLCCILVLFGCFGGSVVGFGCGLVCVPFGWVLFYGMAAV